MKSSLPKSLLPQSKQQDSSRMKRGRHAVARACGKQESGFALIVTITLMVLLTVIAIGLLTLSSITLRSAGQGNAMATAQNNARLALYLALGELQKAAGPDQRITASGNLVDASASPGITGVWESWKPGVNSSTDYSSRKSTVQTDDAVADGEFITWLASGNPDLPVEPSRPPGSPGASDGPVMLLSDRQGVLESQPGIYLSPTLVAGRGGLAWSVLDEGVKARIDLPAEDAPLDAEQRQARLRAPSRPQVEAISSETEALRADSDVTAKWISLNQAELQIGNTSGLRPYLHDLTPHSASLAVNVADGGIKADLTRAFEGTLPTELADRYIYSNSKTRAFAMDPLFSTLAGHYQLYKKPVSPLDVVTPTRYTPMRLDPRTRQNSPNLAGLNGTLVAPVVTRVSVVFSLVSRVGHSHWSTTVPNASQDPERRNMVYLIYTPVVTVYNPYSVPLRFRDLKVTFRNLPVAFKFFRNGQPQTAKPTLLSTFHISSQNRTDWDDPFSLTVSGTAGSASGSLVTLSPGEARVFGVSHSASTGWGSMTNYLWQNDLDSSKTKNVFSGAGWDYRSGYIVDWLVPNIGEPTPDARNKNNNSTLGVFGVRPGDRVNVEVSPVMPGSGGGKFTVDFQAKVNNRDAALGIYEYNYGNQAKLTEILSGGNHSTIGKVEFPFRRERDFSVSELTLPNPDGVSIPAWGSIPKQFAIFTLGARTANDSLYPGKPGRNSSFVQHVLEMDATKNHPGLLPMEMSLLPITGAGANTAGSIDADDSNRAFYFSGTSRGTGAIHYISQNLPSTPLVNLADLRHANLASSGHLPLTPYTVGESLASPMVPSDKATAGSSFGYEVADHAWLANQTLWDGYFFSGIRNEQDADRFFKHAPLALNPRQTALTALDSKEATARATDDTSWSDVASMLAIKGGFNVNSTSQSAWKAVLASLRGLEIPVLGPAEILDRPVNPMSYKEVIRTSGEAAFPRFSRPIGDRVDAGNSADNQRRWSGYRELSDRETDDLAAAIVREVRLRGPFLSMAEFVNRRIGSASDELSTAGAIEAALRKSGINEIPMGPNNRVISEAEAATFGYGNPAAAAGNTEEGASAILSQGDLLSAMGASLAVRSDTFVIRAYGDAREGSRIAARAWCEAVVQRIPEFVDPSDAPEKVQAAILEGGRSVLDLTAVNRRFGRRFEVVSFRWLADDEV